MIRLNSFTKIYLYRGVMDMRKQIRGLSSFVQNEIKLNPFERYLFVFSGKRRRSVKILYWDRTGFCLWQKLLEKDRFIWPKEKDHSCVEMNADQLLFLLEGYDIWKMKPHETLNYKYVS